MIRVLELLIEIYGCPQALRMDNGSELTANVFTEWCETRHIQLMFIEPGKPDQNPYIERFNRRAERRSMLAPVAALSDSIGGWV